MNQNWKNFISSVNGCCSDDGDITFPLSNNLTSSLHPINHLAVLTVSGNDAAKLLQGQITCNINEITETEGCMGAYCTAKGRTICTFLIIKKEDSFLLILPTELLDKVKKKLQLYILRDDVQFTDHRDHYCLFGLNCQPQAASSLKLPEQVFSSTEFNAVHWLKMPSQQLRFIAIANAENAISCWTELTGNKQFKPADTSEWLYLDMLSGIPWLTAETTEQYIPQMLNLDQLKGISFNKGCYVGQEIVARTHYLGKSKRMMYLATCDSTENIAAGTEILAGDNAERQSIGKVLTSLEHEHRTTLLIVVQTSSVDAKILSLQNPNQDKITLSTLSYFV
jgi:folate-binding protein YgfZ